MSAQQRGVKPPPSPPPSPLYSLCFLLFAETNPNALFVRTQHGGHLGYFEGGVLRPKDISWIDRLLVQYADVCVELSSNEKLSQQ